MVCWCIGTLMSWHGHGSMHWHIGARHVGVGSLTWVCISVCGVGHVGGGCALACWCMLMAVWTALGMWGVYQLALVHGHQGACWCTGIRCVLAHWHRHMGVGVHSIDWTRYLLSVMSRLDPHGTHNADSDRCPKQSRTSEDYR